jgi:hypothetical protein
MQPAQRKEGAHQQQRVALHVVMMGAGQLMTGSLAGVMGDRRLIETAPACEPQAHSEINILDVCEIPLVETVDAHERGAPVQRGAGARPEDLPGDVPSPVVAPEPPSLLARAISPQHVPGVVHRSGVVELDHLAGDRAGARIRLRAPDHAGQPVGL